MQTDKVTVISLLLTNFAPKRENKKGRKTQSHQDVESQNHQIMRNGRGTNNFVLFGIRLR